MRSCEPTASLRYPKGWTKATTVRNEKTAIGWIIKQVLGCTTLGPTEKKMGILPPRSGIQVHTLGVYLQDPSIIQSNLGPLDPSYRKNGLEETFGCWFAFPYECGDLPYSLSLRGNCD